MAFAMALDLLTQDGSCVYIFNSQHSVPIARRFVSNKYIKKIISSNANY